MKRKHARAFSNPVSRETRMRSYRVTCPPRRACCYWCGVDFITQNRYTQFCGDLCRTAAQEARIISTKSVEIMGQKNESGTSASLRDEPINKC